MIARLRSPSRRVSRGLALVTAGLLVPFAQVLAVPPPAATLAPEIPWSYAGASGPEHWGDLSPEFSGCRAGLAQSPIDIRLVQPVPYVPLQPHYRIQTLEVMNDGRGVYVVVPPGGELRLGGETWGLTGLHFHAPGETRINGVAAPAEVHFSHRDAQGRVAITVVPIRPGARSNSTLERIAERLPLRPGEHLSYRQVGINPLLLYPPVRGYYSYTGSLANPPCTEPVTWFILAQPVELSAELIGRIARATGGNARPPQPLNGRPVFAALPL